MQSDLFWIVLERSSTVQQLRSSSHGPGHWSRVYRRGQQLLAHIQADAMVVEFFALFHDSMRINDLHDPNHGARGIALAQELDIPRQLSPSQWEVLDYACTYHQTDQVSDHPTIGVCWDADRLDLPRVGIQPDPSRMSTPIGVQWAAACSEQQS